MVARFRQKDDMTVLASVAQWQHVSCLESSHLILETSLSY